MYMMGYNEELSMAHGRKLRPLIPKPPSSPTSPCLGLHAPDHFFAPYHHLGMAEHNQMQASSVVVSSRWNPTPDQLRTLEELYRRGTRTPSADQIQHITAQLRRYGKIEGKNVFYWFQNHKARERQKRRRHFFDSPSGSPQLLDNIIMPKHDDDDDAGDRVAGFEVERNNNTPTTHCTTCPPEMQEDSSRSTKAASMAEQCIHGWVQYDQRELQQQQQQHMMMMRRRNATWHTIPATPTARVTTSTTPTLVPTKGLTNSKSNTSCNNYQDYLNIFITHDHHHRLLHPNTNTNTNTIDYDHQTLELFPLRSENTTVTATATSPAACAYNQKLMMMTDSAMDATTFPPSYQFFEFLPLKN